MTEPPVGVREADRIDVRVSQGRLHAKHARAIARAVAELHRDSDRAPGDTASGTPTPVGLMRRARNSCERLAARAASIGLAPIDVDRAIGALAQVQRERLAWLLSRLEPDRLRRRQGTLCCERTWVDDDLNVRIDLGTESSVHGGLFDVAEDLACLFVDLSSRGAASAGSAFLGEYALETDDYSLFRVIALYAPTAAYELALAAIDAADDSSGVRGRAQALVAIALGPEPAPRVGQLIAVGGGVASGKSTIARGLADSIGAVRVVADSIHDALLEYPAGVPVHELEWTRTFSPEFEERVYDGIYRRAEDAMATGHPVVLDACFPSARRRRDAAELAARNGVTLVFVECRPDAETVRARLDARDERDRSPRGWQELAARLAAHWEARTPEEPGTYVVLDTAGPVRESLAVIRAQISTSDQVSAG